MLRAARAIARLGGGCGGAVAALSAAALGGSLVYSEKAPAQRQFLVSTAAERGMRSSMEDTLVVSEDGTYIAVFDGHGGSDVSAHLEAHAHRSFQSKLARQGNILGSSSTGKDIAYALKASLNEMEEQVLKVRGWNHQGSTAAVICVDGGSIWAANIGDSRAVLSRAGDAIDLTDDHKPNNKEDQARIEALGGHVEWFGWTDPDGRPIEGMGSWRVNGNLAISRSVGDKDELPFISAEPTIKRFPLQPSSDEFIVVASDGLWDVLDSDECVSFVRSALKVGEDKWDGNQKEFRTIIHRRKEKMAKYLADEALRRGSLDNVGVIVLWFAA